MTAAVLLGGLVQAPATAAPPQHDEQITFQSWESYADWRGGTHEGTFAIPGHRTGITMLRPAGETDYADPHTGETKRWAYSAWTSPVKDVGFLASELVPSWNADTPDGTWIQIELQGTYNTGGLTPWYVMGRWASGDQDIKRTSVNRQGDPWSTIFTDTFSIDDVDNGVMLEKYQLKLTLYRKPGQWQSPRVWMLGAMSSMIPDRFTVPLSQGGIAWGTEISVPPHSQNIHRGNYPEWGGGGQVWCSPTSTTMVLEGYGRGPSQEDLAWVTPGYTDPQIPHAARMTWDYTYRGSGNWPFNTAYAATFPGIDAKVTRLHSLDEAERFVKAGIPVVTSISFLAHELEGSNYNTSGHLFVIVGFTEDGDVIVNDPASSSNAAVRHVYKREQLETVWLRTKRINASGGTSGGPGGVAYLIKPWWKPWPHVPGSGNW